VDYAKTPLDRRKWITQKDNLTDKPIYNKVTSKAITMFVSNLMFHISRNQILFTF